ncbi:MAG: hypothetical protein K5669_11600 [Lachnospiraceae bacterium]|nr:hypothetical protein [Lachnospiraceae bacterium]
MIQKIFNSKKIRLIITAIHVILTFLWARRVFNNVGDIPMGTAAINDFIGKRAEIVMTYIITEAFAIILIYFFWRLIFGIVSSFKKEYIIFLSIFLAGAVFIGLMWPDCIYWIGGAFDDNVITYADAVRLTPDYWHSIYHSVIYGASLLFFPADFMIPLVQYGLFVYVISYIFFRVKNVSGKKRWFVFLIFLLPATIELMCYGHRIMYYTLFAVLYMTYIWFDIEEGKERSVAEDIKLALLGSFLVVYRSEGIIIGILLYGIYVIFQGKRKVKRILLGIAVFALMMAAFKLPQKVGDIKYYGKDYQMVNTCNRLRAVFNSEDRVLNYEGAAKDMVAISDVMPVHLITQYGEDGYRRYNNKVRGYADINQTGLDETKSGNYLNAYRNILLHNPEIMKKYIVDSVYYATTGGKLYYLDSYLGTDYELPKWTCNAWDAGRDEMYGNGLTLRWSNLTSKIGLYEKVKSGHQWIMDFMKKMRIILYGMGVLILVNLFIFIRGLILTVKTKEKEHIGKGFIALSLIALLIGTILTMPDALTYYFIISAYLMICALYFSFCVKKKNN